MKTQDKNNHDLLREALWYLGELKKRAYPCAMDIEDDLADLIIRIENEIR